MSERRSTAVTSSCQPGFTGRISPSWITVTASAPSWRKMNPSASPRAPWADGLFWWYSSHSSARSGRWNHIAWSRLAIMNRSSSHECACDITAVSSSVRSDAYATTHACSSGSSGSLPSARNHTSCSGSRGLGSGSSQRGSRDERVSIGRSRRIHSTNVGREPIGVGLQPLAHRRQRFGIGRVGHRVLMLGPGLVDVERRREVEDRAAVLDRDDAPRREAVAVADAVDVVDDRDARVAGRRK